MRGHLLFACQFARSKSVGLPDAKPIDSKVMVTKPIESILENRLSSVHPDILYHQAHKNGFVRHVIGLMEIAYSNESH